MQPVNNHIDLNTVHSVNKTKVDKQYYHEIFKSSGCDLDIKLIDQIGGMQNFRTEPQTWQKNYIEGELKDIREITLVHKEQKIRIWLACCILISSLKYDVQWPMS